MIKKILTTVTLLFILTMSHAQFNCAVKGGLNVTNLYSNQQGMRDWRPSYHIGVSASHAFTKKFYVSSDLLFSDKGFAGNGDRIHLCYVSLPLMAGYTILPKLSTEIGIGMSYLVSSFGMFNGNRVQMWEIWGNRFDLGVQAGVSYAFNTRIKVTLRYEHGLSNTYDRDSTVEYYSEGDPVPTDSKTFRDLGWKEQNRNFQLSFSYVFFGHKK